MLGADIAKLKPKLVLRLASLRHESVPVEGLGKEDSALVPHFVISQKVNVLLHAVRLKLQVPPEDAASHLGDASLLCKLCVLLPYLIMLCDRKRPQRSVEGLASAVDQALRTKELAVLKPDPWHLVHEDKRSLVRVVERLNGRVCDTLVPDAVSPLLQVHVPQLVAARQCLESALEDEISLRERDLRLALLACSRHRKVPKP
mmetsp:Transcript_28977/g.56642  ORF Transcript_28977/g.56642 Transcript_28977/m.56642 type:complete len:202 (+) Transcript_28977:256-861(+)